ncbi:unnamed protein product [Rotaria socialis]|uniref:C2H2-type domain-containing protein n=1 Tax=Rotaria socialis TaxID=392032 RepID=A0A817W883_9BILA|nr:unnamed protein product [Rotaria socialis]CAF3352378.1 unnamed protein product [Rotaria socialis]CAF3643080.1 unnamed protein product [Rotaria socialis]CAF3720867.1 unnamed protein product [Rotaria socialis]CAF3790480.1 unnamed protein product [Rotaria socialis]
MGKDGGFLTPKAIGNRIKAKGLQKLRWYCQSCEKQCRDENGFKCHIQSESHQRQLILVGENSGKYIANYSNEFHSGFFSTLRRSFGTKRVLANTVYCEYIKERDHIHMNATRWVALAGYVRWLGSQGLCEIEQTERGWYVTLIDKDPDTVRREMESERKEKMDLDDEQRRQKLIAEQIKRDKDRGIEPPEAVFTEFVREDENEKVQVTFNQIVVAEKKKTLQPSVLAVVSKKRTSSTDETPDEPEVKKSKPETTIETSVFKKPFPVSAKPKKSALEEVREEEEKMKEKKNRKDYWLHENIVVKIITMKMGEKYYKKKGIITKVENRYQAIIKMIDTNDKIRIDQAHVETVIPAIGKKVLLVNGAYRGQEAILEDIHQDAFSIDVTITKGAMNGIRLDNIPYEDVSKLAD